MVKVLLKDAFARVEVNGSHTQPLQLGRSIRQGFPLALDLFVIDSNALFYILGDSTFSPN